jgi:branched-chain amino acid transport system substrate-binding protein
MHQEVFEMNYGTRFLLTLILCAMLSATFGCTGASPASPAIPKPEVSAPGITADQILVGAYLPYVLALATAQEHGILTYLNDINEKGGLYGRKVKWLAEDDAYQPPKALAISKKLVESDKVFCILASGGIPTTLSVLPYLEEQSVPLLFPYAPMLQLEKPFRRLVFTVIPSSDTQYFFLSDYAIKSLGAKRIAIVYQAGPTTSVDYMLLNIGKAGLSPVMPPEEHKVGQTDFSAIIAKFKQADPDIVIAASVPTQVSLMLKEANKQSFAPRLGWLTHNVVNDPEFIRLAGDLSEGYRTVQIMKPADSPDPEVVEFRGLLKKYYPGDTSPGFSTMYGYYTAKVFCEAMKKAGSSPTRDKIVSALESMTGAALGFQAPLSFSPTQHQGCMSARLVQVQNGKFVTTTDWLQFPVLPDLNAK